MLIVWLRFLRHSVAVSDFASCYVQFLVFEVISSQYSKYDIFVQKFWPLDPISPQIPKFCYINIAFSLETHCCRRHTCTCATKFLHHLGTGCCLPKTTFRTKIGGGAGLGEHPKKLGPLRISATVEASNFKFGTQLGFGTSLPKTNV